MSLLARLNLNYLRIFLVVYRTRSMTLAAKQLHLTQSGVSQQIKSLEDTLGITLFDRINRKIIPTDEAEMLYAECSQRLDDLESTLRQISKQDDELIGRVKIAYSPSLEEARVIEVLARFSRLNPKVKFDLRTGFANEISEWFEKGKIDFALADAFVNEANLDFDEIATEPFDLLVRQDLLEGLDFEKDPFEACCQLPFLTYTEATELLNAWFKKNWGRLPKDLRFQVQVMDTHAMQSLIRRGFGAGLIPESQIPALLLADPQLRRIHIKATVSNRIRVAYLRKRTMGMAAKVCLQWLKDRFAEGSAG